MQFAQIVKEWGGQTPRHRRGLANRFVAPVPLLLAIAAAGCAAGTAAPAGAPVADPAGTAAALAGATVPTERRQINFSWTLEEAGSRVRGKGVVRLQPPDRLRLDLFGPRNESYLSAALVGDDARLPAGARTDVPIPSPALLWAGLGAIRPPAGTELQSATSSGEETVLRYGGGANGEIYEYTATSSPSVRLRRLQRLGSRGPLETVSLTWSDSGGLSRATYRDWSAFRDLTLDIESSVAAAAFPEEIWSP
jgi:hypothetical protein